MNAPCLVPCCIILYFAVNYFNHFKVLLPVCVVYPDNAGVYLLGNIEEYAGSGIVITGAGVGSNSVWAWLYVVMVQECRTVCETQTELKTSHVFTSNIPTYP